MSERELEVGRGVKRACGKQWQDGSFGEWTEGLNGVKSLTITGENGQMAWVPWLRIEKDDGFVQMVNCSELESLELKP